MEGREGALSSEGTRPSLHELRPGAVSSSHTKATALETCPVPVPTPGGRNTPALQGAPWNRVKHTSFLSGACTALPSLLAWLVPPPPGLSSCSSSSRKPAQVRCLFPS